MQFAEVIGQEAIKDKLRQTVLENRVSHAQLFLGPAGTGKLALAIAYAQFINCSGRSETDSCGVCPSCQQFAKLAHPDLHFSYPLIISGSGETGKRISNDYIQQWREYLFDKHFYPEFVEWNARMETEKKQGIIGADEIEQIIKALSYKSYGGKYKVMIIWMAEKIYHAAAPKILKILEEPPDKTLFILIAERKEMLISTILSRTQVVNIPPLDQSSMMNVLDLQFGYPREQLAPVVQAAGGNVNHAVKILEEQISGDFSFGEFRDWMLLCYQGKIKELTEFIAKVAQRSRAGQKQLLSYGLVLSRNCMLNRYDRQDLLAVPDREEEKFILNFSRLINEDNVMDYAGLFEEAINHIDRNGNAHVIFMDTSLKASGLLNPSPAKAKR